MLLTDPGHASLQSPLKTKRLDVTTGTYIQIDGLTIGHELIHPLERASYSHSWKPWGRYFETWPDTSFNKKVDLIRKYLKKRQETILPNKIPELIACLRAKGFSKEADRVSQLHLAEDYIDSGDQAMAADSLKGLIWFLNYHHGLVTRHIVLRSDGRLQLEWPGSGGRYLVITLMDEHAVRYAAVSPDNKRNNKKKIASGTCHYEDVFTDLSPQRVKNWVSWETPNAEVSSSDEQQLADIHSSAAAYLENEGLLDIQYTVGMQDAVRMQNAVRKWLDADQEQQKNWVEAFEERQTAA